MISNPSAEQLAREAELIAIDFRNMLVAWGNNTPPRNGLHASSLLVSEAEWCVRRHVLTELFPGEAKSPQMQPWEWRTQAIFENGWDLHERWQELFKRFGNVVFSTGLDGQPLPELDMTHYDTVRNVYFSPDAIVSFAGVRYVVEIKGVNQEGFEEMTDDLQTAMEACKTVNKAFYQCQLYMHLLQLERGIILVENKNNQDFKLWVIEADREAVQPYIDRMYEFKRARVSHWRKTNNFPARVCHSRGDALARKCPIRDKCFSSGMEG